MDLYEMAESVDSKDSLLRFIRALASDAKVADEESGRMPDDKLNLSPNDWENGSIGAFLDAMAAWASAKSMDTGGPMISDEASWRAFAMILLAGKFYE